MLVERAAVAPNLPPVRYTRMATQLGLLVTPGRKQKLYLKLVNLSNTARRSRLGRTDLAAAGLARHLRRRGGRRRAACRRSPRNAAYPVVRQWAVISSQQSVVRHPFLRTTTCTARRWPSDRRHTQICVQKNTQICVWTNRPSCGIL